MNYLIDYIDFDEGRDFPAELDEPVCAGCDKHFPDLTWSEEFQFFVCPSCLADCEQQVIDERIDAERERAEWMREQRAEWRAA